MSGRRWQVTLGSDVTNVAGFAFEQRAREHVRKHFLSDREDWASLCNTQTLEDLVKQLHQAERDTNNAYSPQCMDILDKLVDLYESTVAEGTSKVARKVSYFENAGRNAEHFAVVSPSGFVAAFSADDMSELHTAFRPLARGVKNPKLRDFLNGAHTYVTTLASSKPRR